MTEKTYAVTTPPQPIAGRVGWYCPPSFDRPLPTITTTPGWAARRMGAGTSFPGALVLEVMGNVVEVTPWTPGQGRPLKCWPVKFGTHPGPWEAQEQAGKLSILRGAHAARLGGVITRQEYTTIRAWAGRLTRKVMLRRRAIFMGVVGAGKTRETRPAYGI